MCSISQLAELDEGPPIPGTDGPATETPDFVPRHPACIAAYNLAQSLLSPAIFNHSVRVYLAATRIAANEQPAGAPTGSATPLFVACILHDIGCAARFNGPLRFEVEGADAAAQHLAQFDGFSAAAIHDVWQAIAVHTSPQIAERISPLARLVRLGVMVDFGRKLPASLDKSGLDAVVTALPRLEIEKVLGDAIVAQALSQGDKAPAASWPGIMLRAKLENPDWDGVNKAF